MTLTELPPLPAALAGRAVRPGDTAYALLRSTYTHIASPAVVLRPRDDDEVAAAVRWAAGAGAVVSVRSGGHGLSGAASNDGGIVIDLGELDAIRVLDRHRRLVRVQAGARWGRVAERLAAEGLAISSGDHGNVGVGGLATAGGVGWLTRGFGLTIDRVRAATVVRADGTIVHTDAEHEPELLWAVRGAGDAVGIVTSFDIEAIELGDIGIAQIAVEVDRDGDGLRAWSEHLATAPRELTTNGLLLADRGRFVLQLTATVASDDAGVVRRLVDPLTGLGLRPLGAQARIAPYTALVNAEQLHPNVGQQRSHTTNALLPRLDARSARAVMDVAAHDASPLVQLRSLGGATRDPAPDATAWAHRDAEVLVVASTFPPDDGSALSAAFEPLRRVSSAAYRNFESSPDAETAARAFPPAVAARIARLRERVDPDGVFRRGRPGEDADLAA
ncbi:FAD-binding oxidoreductase [Microbacterium ulmi]|uniref:FAD-dependent oxidoreductase n=1 Tax=Microbacterium ulmi TaxID=179095 RepID=A0A7Y2M513_9MICO|nr:FAD-dependent oxidoreductase [Microbacterium ulmi]NII70530.1 FAD/FMN-containing dehydrogenase [Microbacterium ulmi]NNH05208.1 FAD-dependent oxidoreductase [Microbacterium ulmi]